MSARLPDLLLVEPEALLRRTIALTARSAHLASVTEAASIDAARSLLGTRRFDGAFIALDLDASHADGGPLGLLELLRDARTGSDTAMPVAVMLERCDAGLLASLKQFGVSKVILKPFRARIVIDAIAELGRPVRTAQG